MGYFLLAALLIMAAVGWGAPSSDARFLARAALAMTAVIAVQMWWGL